MVARAREGRFSADDARTAPEAALERAFDRDGGGWRAKPELRMMVKFATGDLLRDAVSQGAYDLILCRNVVIYFTEPVRDPLHERLAGALRPGGYLMVGSTRARLGAPGRRSGDRPPLHLPEELMDTSEYLGMFLAESREHLQTLNLAVIRIEEAPDDSDTIDEIFRIAHSLKGMSATMGFARMAALTHKMEDVFEMLRGRTGALERRVIDVLLECLDALEGAVEAIERDGDEQLDPTAADRPSGRARRRRSPHRSPRPSAAEPAATPEAVAAYAADVPLLHVSVRLAADVMMPAVRAYMVLAAVADHGETIWSSPTPDEVGRVQRRRGRGVGGHRPRRRDGRGRRPRRPRHRRHHGDRRRPAPPRPPRRPPARPTRPSASPSPPPAPPHRCRPRRHARRTSATVRVDAVRLDQLMHLMGELVVHRTRVESLAQGAPIEGLAEAVGDLTRSSQALQALVMQVRMIQVDAVFMRFPRLVRDLSAKIGKQVDLILTGRDTELDRTVVDALGDPLVHLVRNSLDHALEPPAERAAAGKPVTGVLELVRPPRRRQRVITVRDDGRGIDPGRVARKAVERGLHRRRRGRDRSTCPAPIELLFAAGLLDRRADERHLRPRRRHGRRPHRPCAASAATSSMTSEQGVGTTVQVRLPLTLAIMPALLVESQARAVRHPAGAGRADREPGRADGALGRRASACWCSRMGCCR